MSPIDITLPPAVIGDPTGMRELAGLLKGLADDLGNAQADIEGSVKGMIFEGPAGDAFRERIGGLGSRVTTAVGELQALVSTLEAAATQVEAEQKARAAKVQQLLELRADMARAAARS